MADMKSKEEWQSLAQSLDLRTHAFIDGKSVAAVSGERFSRISPVDGRHLGDVAAGDAADIDHAVASARAAFEDGRWSRTDPRHRRRVLLRLADLMEDHAEELALTETLDMGKPIRDSLSVDLPLAIGTVRFYAEAMDKIYDEIGPTGPDAVSMIVREPLGVIGAVVPWNFPLMLASWKFAPALATGNSIVLKPAEQSPFSALRVAELALEAGIPEGVFNVVPGFGETAGQALGRHMDVDAVAFTGSAEVGRKFLVYSGESNMKRVSLECGGKSPHIIMGDCGDLDSAARAAALGIFFNQGEVCTAGSRLLVDAKIKDGFLDRVLGHARALTVGDPLDPASDLGAIVDDKQMSRVLHYIDIGRNEGANLVLGGRRVLSESGGYYVEPTIFDQVSTDMTIAREEIFGPVLSTLTFNDAEEAIRVANDTIYGLAAAIWTDNVHTAHKAARALRAGSVWVNCWDDSDITTPFGGFKQSGFGRDRSLHALDKYTDLKTIWMALK